MTSSIKFDRHILSLDDTQLEQFVRDWVAQKQEYYEVTPFKGTGDKGRDVVGFLTKERHEGEWHNFQCKQYSSNLGTAKAILEIGKILYYSYLGDFTPPSKFYLVAPKGIVSARHDSKNIDNLSNFLLEELGLSGKEIAKDASATKRSLSFRDLAHLQARKTSRPMPLAEVSELSVMSTPPMQETRVC